MKPCKAVPINTTGPHGVVIIGFSHSLGDGGLSRRLSYGRLLAKTGHTGTESRCNY